MYYKMISMDSHETWAPAVGEEANVGAPPLKIKDLQFIHPIWGAFSPCEGLSATFLLMEAIFRHVGAFFAIFSRYGDLFAIFPLIGGLFSMWGAFFGLPPPHPTIISVSTHGPCYDINLNVIFVEMSLPLLRKFISVDRDRSMIQQHINCTHI